MCALEAVLVHHAVDEGAAGRGDVSRASGTGAAASRAADGKQNQ